MAASPKETSEKFTIDWLLSDNGIGGFGPYQKKIYFLLGFPTIICAMHVLSWVFLGANAKHRCQIEGEQDLSSNNSNLSPDLLFRQYFPMSHGPDGGWSQCDKFNESQVKMSELSWRNMTKIENQVEIVPCNGKYIFDKSVYSTSVRMDFQLICENQVWYTLAETLFKSGLLVGALIFGSLSDRFGRRPMFLISLCQQAMFGLVAAAAPNFTIFVIFRFLVGMACSGVFLVSFVIVMELVGKEKRTLAAMGIHLFFAFGYIFLGCLAFFIREWRYLQLAISLPGVLLLPYYWLIPESVRWLLANGKKNEAVLMLKEIAHKNGKEISETELSQINIEGCGVEPSLKFSEIIKYRKTMLRSLIIFFCWFVISGVYYGLSLNSGNLGGNDYVNFILLGVVDIPACGIALLTDQFGRKRILCPCMILAGIFLISCGFISESEEWGWLLITLNMLGKLLNAVAYAAIYMYSAELFPTVIRNSFMGTSSVSAEVGGILSDFVLLLQISWKPAPDIVFGIVSLAAGILSLMLPETWKEKLPETMEDSENFGQQAKNI